MFYIIILWLLAISHYIVRVDNYQLNITEYYKMPYLYNFDDYDRCLQEFTKNTSTYCFVRAEVMPQNDSNAWKAIEEISKFPKHHFDHRHLYYGLCVRWCKTELAELNVNDTENEFYGGILTNNSKVNTYLGLFSMEESNRLRYNRILNQCLNVRLNKHYNLEAKSVIEYCETNHQTIEEDTWNLAFYGVVCMLILLVTASSLYDFYLQQRHNDKISIGRDHYKIPLNDSGNKFGVTFSIARNWYRLNQEPSGKIGRDLRFLDCFKFFSMFFVVFAHVNWILYEGAISNPQDLEQLSHTLAGTILVSGALITVTFMVIAGFLLSLSWLAVLKVKSDMTSAEYVGAFLTFNVFRYLRLTIPYAFVLLLSGVYFENPGGPLWRHIFEREQLSCRKNWWTNLLYINNYVNSNERCMLQSWYLATDTHSFVLSLLLLMFATKWPKIRNHLFGAVLGIAYCLPGIVTYVNKFSPVYSAAPQSQKDSFIDDVEFSEFYAPFYMNFGCYFCGVVAALIYNHISIRQFQLHKYKSFQIVWHSLIPFGIFWLFTAHPMVQTNEPSLFWGSVYATMQRNTWAIGLAIMIVGMATKTGWILRKFASMPIFRVLGRLTYGTYVIHLFVARLVMATLRHPIYFGTGTMFAFIVFTMTTSYLFSFVLAIFIELPVSALLKLLR